MSVNNGEPIIVNPARLEWETWAEEEAAARGIVFWKTLLSRDRTDSYALTMGVARIAPGERLHAHRHAQAEAYYILNGAGAVEIDGQPRAVESGAAIFIPG